jgi:pyruvate dehydrogenase kinase 2/3/4
MSTFSSRPLLQRQLVRYHNRITTTITNTPAIRPIILLNASRPSSPPSRRHLSFGHQPSNFQWQSSRALEAWVEKPARPVSLRQLIFFGGRHLDERRLLDSANYVRTELPTRIARKYPRSLLFLSSFCRPVVAKRCCTDRIRDMQKLPYVVVTNPHISYVYQLYCEAFDSFRKIKEIRNQEDNDKFCAVLKQALHRHLTVIPKLVMGVLECRDLMPPEQLDKFMNTLLRSVCFFHSLPTSN